MKQRMSEIPDFTSAAWQESRSDTQLLIGILEGKGNRMPPYGDRLTDREAEEQVAMVRAFRNATPKP